MSNDALFARTTLIGWGLMLSSLSKRLHATRTFEEAIATILDDIIALHGAEYMATSNCQSGMSWPSWRSVALPRRS